MNTTPLLSLLVAIASMAGCTAPGDVENHRVLEENQDTSELQLEPYGDATRQETDADSTHRFKLAASSYERPASLQETVQLQGSTTSHSVEVEFVVNDTADLRVTSTPAMLTSSPNTNLSSNNEIQSVPVTASTEQIRASIVASTLNPPFDPTAPSIHGIDRSHWQKTTIGPTSAITHHHPIYFRDASVYHRYPQIIDGTSKLASLAGNLAANYDQTNWLNLVSQPVKLGTDAVLLGWYMVHRHPWTNVTTP